MPIPTLLLPPRYGEDSNALWSAAISAGWNVERVPSWRLPEGFSPERPVLYGEPLFVASLAAALNLAPLEPPFDWLAKLPFAYRQRHILACSLSEARRMPFPAFIKPADDKCFPARVYASACEFSVHELVPDNTPVLVSEPVTWRLEMRCFVLDRAVLTLSPYARLGTLAQAEDGSWPIAPEEKQGALSLMNCLLNDPQVALPPAVVVDIGLIEGRGWAVVEANPCFSSGLYGCSPGEVLRVIERGCVGLDSIGDLERAWVLNR